MPDRPTHAAFLRAINVGGRRVGNAELCEHLGSIGLSGVAGFRASGNVVFSAEPQSDPSCRPEALTGRIEAGLAAALGYEVVAFVRTAAEVREMAARKPFDAELVSASRGKLQVALLSSRAPTAARRRALALASEEDLLAVSGSELYWLPSGGVLDSALEMKTIERALGPITFRTQGTIEQIAKRHFAG